MFEISENLNVREEIFQESTIFTIDNFYQDPDSIVNFLSTIEPELWKIDKKYQPSHNGIYFEDRKHQIKSGEIHKVFYFLQKLNNHIICDIDDIDTNVTRFKKDKFNDYKNNYWCPHRDIGYTAVIYLNKNDTESGTNLYENLDPENEPPQEYSEHYYPWRPKNKYKLLKSIQPKYNRLIMFDGRKCLHGMNICNDDYFGENYRINQVYFFEKP